MSYTRPAATAATASWQGSGAYTRPVADAAAAQWLVVYPASGFSTTAFGTPSILAGDTQTGDAAGFLLTAFGAPGGASVNPAGSLPSSAFGAHSVAFTATSLLAAQFGVPSGQSLLRARSLLATSRFGAPLALFVDRTCTAQGFASNIGSPYGGLFTTPAYDTVTKARYMVRARFGTPSSPVQQTCVAGSIAASRFGVHTKGAVPLSAFGTHTSFFVYPAAGLPPSVFGAHGAASGHAVSGFAQSVFGSPYAGREQTAAPTNRTRFGTPVSDMQGVHKAYGFRRSWFGNHRSLRDVSETSGWQSSGFGAPVSHEVHRALHIPPEHKFGTHLMKRAA